MTNKANEAAGFIPADRMRHVGVSKILAMGMRAAEMKKAGRQTIILGAGEPDFDTPTHIKEAASAAMMRGETKYTHLDGSPKMKAAVIEKFRRDNGLEFTPDEVSVSSGAKQVIFNAFMASLCKGDEVIIATPCWTSYIDIVNITEGTPVEIPCDDSTGFKLTAQALEAAISPNTRWVLLNSPSNPTGSAYRTEDYIPLIDVLRRHPQVWLMVDDMYEHITYEGFDFVTPLQLAPDLRDRTVIVNGVSKAYAMTGWRIGYGAGPKALIKSMAAVQSQSTSCPSSISQAGAIAALTGPQNFLKERARVFQSRRDLVVKRLNAIDGITCRTPEGAFYTFANCKGLIGKTAPDGTVIDSDTAFCNWVLDSTGVAMVPGEAFGVSPYFRISYATSTEDLTEALERLEKACLSLTS